MSRKKLVSFATIAALLFLACMVAPSMLRTSTAQAPFVPGEQKLLNGDFSQPGTTDTQAANWRNFPDVAGFVGYRRERQSDGSYAIRVDAGPGRYTAGAYQTYPVTTVNGQTLKVWLKTEGAIKKIPTAISGVTQLGVNIYAEYYPSDGGPKLYGTPYAYYPTESEDWTEVGFQSPTGVAIYRIDLVVGIFSGEGTAWFKNARLEEYVRAGEGAGTIQFDDGLEVADTIGRDVLGQYGYPGSLALVSDWLNQRGFLSTQQVLRLINLKWDVLSHTKTHPDLPALYLASGPDAVAWEIQQSARDLERELCVPIFHFAAPFGSQTGETQSIAELEYDSQRTFWDGMNHHGVFPKTVRVISLDHKLSPAMLDMKLQWIKNDHVWIDFVVHNICANPAPDSFDITPEGFKYAIRRMHEFGIRVLNYEDALIEFADRPGIPRQGDWRPRIINNPRPKIDRGGGSPRHVGN